MNQEADQLITQRNDDIKQAGGLTGYRLLALKHLKVKTVVKESHCSVIQSLVFNHTEPELYRLFGTVGKDQATVYDDEHMGDHIGVVVHFSNQETKHTTGGELQACTWLHAAKWAEQPYGDACLAVAGEDQNISVISVVQARVVAILRGHTTDVIELACCSGRPDMLASLAKDGNIRLWHLPSSSCFASYASDACSIAMEPAGREFASGNRAGNLHLWQVPPVSGKAAGSPKAGKPKDVPSKQQLKMSGGRLDDSIDCMRFLAGGRLAVKAVDGRMHIYDYATRASLQTWKVPSSSAANSLAHRCAFGHTPDGRFICVGNSQGNVLVYDTESGARITQVAPIKVTAPVRACGLSNDCRHLLSVLGNGYLFRYQYCQPEATTGEGEADDVAGGNDTVDET